VKTFKLNQWNLRQIETAFEAYKKTEKEMIYGIAGSIKYDAEFDSEKPKAKIEDVIEEMRKH